MERLSDKAIEIINALHTERLDYYSEYLPLIDCAHRCAAYEDTDLEPEEIERILDAYGRGMTLRTESTKRLELMRDILTERLKELSQAEKDGRLAVLPANNPLTLEELRGMVDQPVWIKAPGISNDISGRWVIVEGVDLEDRTIYTEGDFSCHDYGAAWLAYRRKPEEGKNG